MTRRNSKKEVKLDHCGTLADGSEGLPENEILRNVLDVP
jgi:hypothetical protein